MPVRRRLVAPVEVELVTSRRYGLVSGRGQIGPATRSSTPVLRGVRDHLLDVAVHAPVQLLDRRRAAALPTAQVHCARRRLDDRPPMSHVRNESEGHVTASPGPATTRGGVASLEPQPLGGTGTLATSG